MAQTEDPESQNAVYSNAARNGVAAVIVTYFPEPVALRALVETIVPQVERVFVVDNTAAGRSHADLKALCSSTCEIVPNGCNLGLAAAQNQGIARAKAHGLSWVILLDQDSLPAPEMVKQLLAAARELHIQGVRVGAIGPRWHDRHAGVDVPFVRLGLGRMRSQPCKAVNGTARATIECDTLVASGCLMPMTSLDAIGPMDESLFIDQIDVEWGIRAQARGFQLFGACEAVLYHGIGERTVPVWFAPGRRLPVHAPVRDYYLVRNTVAVFFVRRAPWRWQLLQALRLPGLMLVLATQVPPRWVRSKMMVLGIIDALRRRSGSLA